MDNSGKIDFTLLTPPTEYIICPGIHKPEELVDVKLPEEELEELLEELDEELLEDSMLPEDELDEDDELDEELLEELDEDDELEEEELLEVDELVELEGQDGNSFRKYIFPALLPL